jgi:hypothetical protein
LVAGDEGAAHRDGDEAGGAADVEWLAVGAAYDGDDVGVAGDAAGRAGAEEVATVDRAQLAVNFVLECVEGGGDQQVGSFAAHVG